MKKMECLSLSHRERSSTPEIEHNWTQVWIKLSSKILFKISAVWITNLNSGGMIWKEESKKDDVTCSFFAITP